MTNAFERRLPNMPNLSRLSQWQGRNVIVDDVVRSMHRAIGQIDSAERIASCRRAEEMTAHTESAMRELVQLVHANDDNALTRVAFSAINEIASAQPILRGIIADRIEREWYSHTLRSERRP